MWDSDGMGPNLTLELEAIPERVPGARRAVTNLCEALGVTDDLRERVRLATTEACANCVRHAYEEHVANAVFELDAHIEENALVVTVRDGGSGYFAGRAPPADDGGLGIGLIDRVADRADIWSRPGQGTRITMRFVLRGGGHGRSPAWPGSLAA
jgi:anti-sigma regulatory factor (Ser/Thr protein kinase)